MQLTLEEKVYRIAESVTMQSVLNYYGYSAKHEKDRIPCPLHHGKNNNFSYNNKKFQCFVCGESGNAISFVAKLFGISNLEASKKIDNDFNLGVFEEEESWLSMRKQKRHAKRMKEEQERLRKQETQRKLLCLLYEEFRAVDADIAQCKDLDRLKQLCDLKTTIEAYTEDLKEKLNETIKTS